MDILDFFEPILPALIKNCVVLIITYSLTVAFLPFLTGMLREAGYLKLNYRAEKIPTSAGLIFLIILPVALTLGILFSIFTAIHSFLLLFVILGMGLMGLVDDRSENAVTKGFKGHILTLIKEKRLTTGGFKACFGALIALVFSIGSLKITRTSTWIISSVFLNFLLVSLSANTINLFDLRPGRAGKVYLVGFILILAFSKNLEIYLGMFLPFMVIMLYYLRWDLQSKVMMGDVGSNLLGASLGIMMAWMLSDLGKIVALCILIGLQVAAEKFSFTQFILRFGWLKYLDELGRRKN